MRSTIGKVGLVLAVALPLFAGVVALPAASAVSSALAGAQACTASRFTVVWSTAGVYEFYWNGEALEARHLYNKHLGDEVRGPTGGTANGWTQVYTGSGGRAFMKDAALRYDYCQ